VNTNRLKIQSTRNLSATEQQMRGMGIVTMYCDESGSVQSHIQNDWLVDLLLSSPIFTRGVTSQIPNWITQNPPQVCEVCTGIWVAPVKQNASRRNTEFALGVIISDACVKGEYFHALCQASNADVTVIQELIQSSLPIATHDVKRIATLFQLAWESQLKEEANQSTIESFGHELADSYEEISLLYTMSGSMNSVDHPERYIELACNELLQTLPYGWVGVQLNIGDRLPKPGNEMVMAALSQKTPQDVQCDVQAVLDSIQPGQTIISNSEDDISSLFGAATIIEPIESDGVIIGILIAANKQGSDSTASSVDAKLLAATASQLGIFLENALLYENLNATFLGTLEALTTSIDAKDKYTCGHSQRVALLTAQLAEKAGLDADQVDRCRIAGLVHDIGKIGVPEHVLLKQGGLTDEEFESIQKHPEIGARILRDIPQMEDILGGVLHHHEKFDGSGYPHGIAGDDIPFIARMISLADTFDAMSSSRTYRNAMTRQSVLNEMKRVSGTQFDPELAEQFFTLDFSAWEKMMIEHQARAPITRKEAA